MGQLRTHFLNSLSLRSCMFLFTLLASPAGHNSSLWQHKLLHYLHLGPTTLPLCLSVAGRDNIVSALTAVSKPLCVGLTWRGLAQGKCLHLQQVEFYIPASIRLHGWECAVVLVYVFSSCILAFDRFSESMQVLLQHCLQPWRPRKMSVFGFHFHSDT